jgi:hypothetical protein
MTSILFYIRKGEQETIISINLEKRQQQQQQQHSLLSQASWGRLEMKPKRDKSRKETISINITSIGTAEETAPRKLTSEGVDV